MLLFYLNRAALIATSETAKYTKSVLPVSGLVRIGGWAKYLFDFGEIPITSFHSARLASLRMEKNGFRWSVNREINRPKAANRLVSCCTPFLELGAGDSKIA